MLFITPFNYNYNLIDNILNSKQKELVKKFISSDKYSNFYFDLKSISNKILFDKKNNQIDCYDALYINKCNLVELSTKYDPNNDFINDFRKYISLDEQHKIYELNKKIYTRILK